MLEDQLSATRTRAEQRADIVAKYAAGESVSALARLYSVSRANILSVVKPISVQ